MSSFDPILDRGKQHFLDNEQELNAAGVSEDRIRKIKANAIMLDELSRREWDDYLKRRNEIFEKSDATGHAYLRAVREASKSIRSEFAKRKFVEQEGPRVQAVKLHDMYRNGFNAEFGSEHLVRREFEKREEVFQPGVLTEMMREMSNFDVFAEALGIGMQREPKLENESDAEHMKRVADEHTLFAVGMKFLSQNRLERDTFRNKFGLTETAGGEAILERLLDRHPALKERFSTEEQFKDTVRFLQARHHYMQLAAGLDEAAVELSKANDETYTDSRESLLLILDGAWNELKALKEKMPDGFIEKEIGPAAQRASGVSRAGRTPAATGSTERRCS